MNTAILNAFFLDNRVWERLESAITSEDDIGVVLRGHLLTERLIETWCCAASGNKNFFDGFGENITLSYLAKLKLAFNFGLSEFSYNELKKINKIRNNGAHKPDDTLLTDENINGLIELIKKGG